MMTRIAVAVLKAEKGFRRLKGHAEMPSLVAALRASDQQFGIATSVENRLPGYRHRDQE
jgi:hypothetical protein